MEKQKINKKHSFSLMKNLGINLNILSKRKNIIKKNKTFTNENNNKNRRNTKHLKFGQNLLVWLLKKPKYMANSRNPSTNRKRKNHFIENIENKNQLSEKYKYIPGINKLHYLTDQSMNELLKTEQETYHFTFSNFNKFFANNENKNKIKNVYNSAFRSSKKLSLDQIKNEKEYKDESLKTECTFLGINLSDKLSQKYRDNIINTKQFYKPKDIFINNSNSNYINNLDINNNKTKTSIKDSFFHLMKKNKMNQGIKLYIRPNENSQKVILTNNNIISNKQKLNKTKKRVIFQEIQNRRAHTHENLFDEKSYFKNQFESNKINNENNTSENKKLNINNNKKKFLNKSSKVDRLLFKLENPYECFEENVCTNNPGDKFVFLKNQIIKQKHKTTKLFYDYKKQLKSNETQMTRYIYKLYSDRNKNKII